MTTINDISIKRNDTRRHTFTIKDSDSNIVDISAWTSFAMSIHSIKNPVDETTLEETITGQLITDGIDGRVGFTPSGAIDPDKYYYDAQAIDSNSEKITFSEGEYLVTQDRTKV